MVGMCLSRPVSKAAQPRAGATDPPGDNSTIRKGSSTPSQGYAGAPVTVTPYSLSNINNDCLEYNLLMSSIDRWLN